MYGYWSVLTQLWFSGASTKLPVCNFLQKWDRTWIWNLKNELWLPWFGEFTASWVTVSFSWNPCFGLKVFVGKFSFFWNDFGIWWQNICLSACASWYQEPLCLTWAWTGSCFWCSGCDLKETSVFQTENSRAELVLAVAEEDPGVALGKCDSQNSSGKQHTGRPLKNRYQEVQPHWLDLSL